MRQFVARGPEQLQGVAKVITGLSPEKPWRIQLTPYRAKRSPEQNKLLWAIYTEISKETGNDPEAIHEAMKAKFLPPRFIRLGEEEVPVNASSTELDVLEFSDFVEKVSSFAAQELGIQVLAA